MSVNQSVDQKNMQAIMDAIAQDYQHFPKDQSYHLYATDVYFQDPLTRFRGIKRYRAMIGFIDRWFRDPHLALQSMEVTAPDTLTTRWILSWTAPMPWQPRMSISGWSELRINAENLIVSHIDYWDCSRLDVLKQLFNSDPQSNL